MVFAWNEAQPDPRKSPSLVPTGDFARILDRYGFAWTIYEFGHLGDDLFGVPTTYYTYGVRVGDLHHAEPGQPLPPGIDGTYNWVVTYRLDRLFPDRFEATPEGVVATAAPLPGPPLPDLTTTAVTAIADPSVRDVRPAAPEEETRVVFGLARVPASLASADPAEAPHRRPVA